MSKRVLLSTFLMLSAVTLAACGSNTSAAGPGAGGGRGGRGRGGDGAAAPVVTAKVAEKDVPVDIAAIGNVEAYTMISVRSQVTGQLTEIGFREGDSVKQGQQLFTLDRRPFEAALAQAEANLTRDKALMAQAEAQLSRDAANAEYQQLSAERQAQLNTRGIVSKDQADQARAQADATSAVVKADRAAVESARAQLAAQDAAVVNALADVPGIEDLTSDLEVTSPQVDVQIDRDKAAALGVTASQIENAFYDAYGPRWVSTIYAPVNEYKVLLELAPQFQADPAALSLLYFKGSGAVVPLDTLATAREQVGPQTVNHYGQLPAVTLSFGLTPGASLGGVLNDVGAIAGQTMPEGVSGQFQGAAKAFEGALSNLALLLLIAVMVV